MCSRNGDSYLVYGHNCTYPKMKSNPPHIKLYSPHILFFSTTLDKDKIMCFSMPTDMVPSKVTVRKARLGCLSSCIPMTPHLSLSSYMFISSSSHTFTPSSKHMSLCLPLLLYINSCIPLIFHQVMKTLYYSFLLFPFSHDIRAM